MNNYRITYKRLKGGRYQARVIWASCAAEARQVLIASEPVWTIRSISIKCRGRTAAGEPCQRFTKHDYCCDRHQLEDWRRPGGRS